MSDIEYVVLRAGTKFRFPDLCVACGSPHPGHTMWLWALDYESKKSMFSWLRTPICGSCSSRLRIQRWSRLAGWLLVFLGIIGVLMFIPADWQSGNVEKGVAGVLAGAAVLIMFAWDWIFPARFTFSGDKTLFSFRSATAAQAFKQLNKQIEVTDSVGKREDEPATWPIRENYQGGLGAAIWEYCVPYQADIQKALSELRDREFRAGRFYMSELLPKSIDDAIRNADAPGTRSILDVSHISTTRDVGVISPAPADEIWRLFGTNRPTKAMVERASREWTDEFGGFLEAYDRGEGVYWILYENGQPSEIYFAGWSHD
jgi:hypothetical protein